MLTVLVDPASTGSQSIDSTTSKAHRCAAGGKATVLSVKRRFAFL
jgi:hypothetical protein